MNKFSFVKNLKTKKEDVGKSTINIILKHIIKTGEGYECIQSACIPYYDFEKEYKSERTCIRNYQSDLDFALNAIKLKYPNGKIYEFTSCGYDCVKKMYKNSFHFRVRGVGYYNTASQVHKLEGFDPAVYNNGSQLFRLPYCSKKGQNRFLKRFDSATGKIYELDGIPDEYEDYLVQNIKDEVEIVSLNLKKDKPSDNISDTSPEVDMYIEKVKKSSKILDNMNYKSHTMGSKLIINFRRQSPSYCDTCERTHDCDATPYLTVLHDDNKIFWCCIRNKVSKFICKIDDDKECKDYVKVDKLTKTGLQFNEKYCSNIPIIVDAIENKTHDTIFIKSNMGTGKTYACAKSINKQLNFGTNLENLKAGVISFRISLANKYAEDFKGFACYNNTKGVIEVDKWICQLDSLHRIQRKPMDYLILDEASQIRKHLTSDTYLSNPNYLKNIAALRYFMRTPKLVVLMDANLTDTDKQWVESIRTVSTPLVIVNNYRGQPRTVNLVSNDDSISLRIKADLLNNRKFVLAHNGRVSKIKTIYNDLLSAGATNILMITSETMGDDNVKLALNNPNVEFGKYEGVIYSPSVQSGLSYDKFDTIHTIYGIFGNATNCSEDACQMLHRVRNPISNKMYVSINTYNFVGNIKPTTVPSMMMYLKSNRSHLLGNDMNSLTQRVSFEYDDFGNTQFSESDILLEYCKNKVVYNLDSIMYKKNFINHQISYGNIVVEDKKKDGDEEKKQRISIKKSGEIVKDNEAIELNDADDISETQASEITKKITDEPAKVEKHQYIELKKYNINKFYKQSGVHNTQWYKTYINPIIKKHYYNQSIYFKLKNFNKDLEQLKENEIYFSKRQVGEDEYKSIDQCVVDSIISTPRYMKHKILIEWLSSLGFHSLNSSLEIEGLENIINKCKITKDICNVLGAGYKILDDVVEKNIFRFINARLKEEFGISIKKINKNKLCNKYKLNNPYIDNNLFDVDDNDMNIPVLGTSINKVRDNDFYKNMVDRYGEDDECLSDVD